MDLSEHAKVNRAAWNVSAADYVESAQRNWDTDEISWGIWNVPESEVGALPDVGGMDVVELGCGTAYVSAWLARRGARPIGIDLSENQLATARTMQAEHALEFPLVHASAEDVPLSAESADLVISEYGASLWCDPDLWLREASRLLRADGWLVFLTNSLMAALCTPDVGAAADRLVRDQRGLRVVTYPEEGVEFHLAHGDWIATLARHGFAVTALHELYAPDGAQQTRYEWVTPEWAHRWPVEEIWVARRTDT
ncbi:MAG TPA: class I SAM-dependent methyltransferase [Solirubrobacter sp.]